MNIKISTTVFPTESEEKLLNALQKVFQIDFTIKNNQILAETKNIDSLLLVRQKIADARIKTTVLYLLEKNKDGKNSKLELNKQTLVKGKIHFVEEKQPLGNIVIEFDDVDAAAMYFSS